MPFCPQCGVENPDTARFCDQCGATLIPVVKAAPGTTMPAPTATMPAPAPAQGGAVSAGPAICPQCGASAIPGEAFCDNCGASLLGGARPTAAAMPTAGYSGGGAIPQPNYPAPQPAAQPNYTPPTPAYTPPPAAYSPAPTMRSTLAPGQLILHSTGVSLPLPSRNNALIGRSDTVSGFFPDIDLGGHGALEAGVGRRHMMLSIQGVSIVAEDLNSTNGSFINGQKLQPNMPQPLSNGDELRLGNLVFEVRIG
ncbi:zinc-ribbon domain-containing protein [Candidatus Gracilibacteria bacterium]|nr:zinc-ribbon domain-containing protein [Candidatus Gracilibacteria bacterium]